MARKRANKTLETISAVVNPKTPPVESTITALSQKEMEAIQNMANMNATYAGLLKQQTQYESALTVLKYRRNQILNNEIKLPIMIKLSERLYYAESDKDKVLKTIDDEIKNIQLAINGLRGTIEYRKDTYKESLIRVTNLLKEKIKNENIEKIIGADVEITSETKEQEKLAIEKEFDKELKKRSEK